MAEITAKAVQELRKKTGLGMMDCKKALQETDGDLEKAVEHLRKQGMSAVEKRAGRDASDGLIESYIHQGSRLGVLVEVNCETDFVAKDDSFRGFAKAISGVLLRDRPGSVEEVAQLELSSGQTVEAARRELIAKIGENISLRRFELIEGEADTRELALAAFSAGADIIMLDNMPPTEMKEIISEVRKENIGREILFEASGNINDETIKSVAETGVDIISVGAVTHSVKATDIALDIEIR